jgi:hypothetical protein
VVGASPAREITKQKNKKGRQASFAIQSHLENSALAVGSAHVARSAPMLQATCSLNRLLMIQRSTSKPKVVGGTGFEPVTPTMSR